jgi:hypothetical protein
MQPSIQTSELYAAVQCYFDILHECDLSKFDHLFHPACQLFTVVEGAELLLSASEYRDVLVKRASPISVGQPREESIIASYDLSESIAMVKVRVRLGEKVYRDHLNFVRAGTNWKLVAKLYALEESGDEEASVAMNV